MIAKRVSRARSKDAFKRLGLYILGEKDKAKPHANGGGMWQRTAAYVLDLDEGGGRVGAIRISNCEAAEPADAIAEIQAVQAMNSRAKGDKTYHLVVSFPPGEKPSETQLRDIEDELCAAIGLADHQRISAVHTDSDHLHIHVAINKVHAVIGGDVLIPPFEPQQAGSDWNDLAQLLGDRLRPVLNAALAAAGRRLSAGRARHGGDDTQPRPKRSSQSTR
jgi:hypothetical protein